MVFILVIVNFILLVRVHLQTKLQTSKTKLMYIQRWTFKKFLDQSLGTFWDIKFFEISL